MPSWGRPSGGRGNGPKKRGSKQREQWDHDRNIQELDSAGELDQGFGQNGSFRSDKLHFTGVDMSRSTDQRQLNYSHTSETSDDMDEDTDDGTGEKMQLVLRDKEELLVQKALERIRHAQMLGKTNVKLTKPELDALERKRRKEQARREREDSSLRPGERRRSSTKFKGGSDKAPKGSVQKMIRTPISAFNYEGFSSSGSADVGLIHSGAQDIAAQTRLNAYAPAPQYIPSKHPDSRSSSSHSHRRETPPLLPPQGHTQKKRYFSVPESPYTPPMTRTPPSPRPLPDDPDWIPRPRSSSCLSSHESRQHQAYSPPVPQSPPHYNRDRRTASGPPGVVYPPLRRTAPLARAYASPTDATGLRRELSADYVTNYIGNGGFSEYDEDGRTLPSDPSHFPHGYGVSSSQEYSSSNRPRRGFR